MRHTRVGRRQDLRARAQVAYGLLYTIIGYRPVRVNDVNRNRIRTIDLAARLNTVDLIESSL